MHFDGSNYTEDRDQSRESIGDSLRRLYRAPRMRKVGSLYEVTLGGSPGSGDSVNTSTTSIPSGGKRGGSPTFPHP